MMLHLLANRACGELFGGGEPAALNPENCRSQLNWQSPEAICCVGYQTLCAGHQALLCCSAQHLVRQGSNPALIQV